MKDNKTLEELVELKELEEIKNAYKRRVALLISIPVILIIVIIVACMVKVVPAGYVGVVYNINGGVEPNTKAQGWSIMPPTKHLTLYNIATQQLYLSQDSREGSVEDDSFYANCKDGQVNVDVEMSYHIDAERAVEIFNKYGGLSSEKIVDTYVRAKVKTLVSEITSTYSVIDVVMDKKAEVNVAITSHLREQLNSFGIYVESANLSRTDPGAEVQSTITERSNLSQQIELDRKRQEQLTIEAENKKIEAEGEATKLLIEANNQAEIERLKADAEAYANKVLAESITQSLIDMRLAEAREKHGWVTIQGAGNTIVDSKTDTTE